MGIFDIFKQEHIQVNARVSHLFNTEADHVVWLNVMSISDENIDDLTIVVNGKTVYLDGPMVAGDYLAFKLCEIHIEGHKLKNVEYSYNIGESDSNNIDVIVRYMCNEYKHNIDINNIVAKVISNI